MLLTKRFPFLTTFAVAFYRAKRQFLWYFGNRRYAVTRRAKRLEKRLFCHKSVLIRKLGSADMRLQYNKVRNLKLAAARVDGIVIQPGETFSLWRLIGEPTKRKGYVEGMLLSNGEVKAGIGGGLCQLANLLYWMTLHTPLIVTERFHHSVDIFPDSGRVLPFGTGATIFYNYIDLQFYNPTDQPFQFSVWLGTSVATDVPRRNLPPRRGFLRPRDALSISSGRARSRISLQHQRKAALSDK